MKKIAVVMLLAAMSCLHAQELVSRVFQLKYASADHVKNVLLGAEKLSNDNQTNTIAVMATKSKMDEFEEIIKRLDVPPPPTPNVEVTIYLMSALPQPATSPTPPELEGVIKQLRSMFSYKGYELIDTQVIRTRAGKGGSASGTLDRGTSGPKAINRVQFSEATVSSDQKGRAVYLRGLRVGLSIPVNTAPPGAPAASFNFVDSGITTDVDVHEGQKVVVGKANMDGSDKASIVVLTAKVVD